ncbi:PA1571 family protein [Pseudomonas sp. URMO17WK12:I4]|uniref:PA1571 family protein n=1 Tax=Pseudomonas sp. URMO17WK12:I4 TaxID=1283292 RepID=UPI0004B264FA|nr:PA1571 family protein [Pseudomonas sp. URMO17WK12:I4]
MSSTDKQQSPQSDTSCELAHGALIDPNGREIPITESMIQQACNELDKGTAAERKDPSH